MRRFTRSMPAMVWGHTNSHRALSTTPCLSYKIVIPDYDPVGGQKGPEYKHLLGDPIIKNTVPAHAPYKKYCNFYGKMVMLGFGSIGQGTLPLLLRHIGGLTPDRFRILTGDERGRDVAERYGVQFEVRPLTEENYRDILSPLLKEGDFLLNASVSVGSVDLIKWCQQHGVNYLDSDNVPWPGSEDDDIVGSTNYGFRWEGLSATRTTRDPDPLEKRPTCVLTHGANPGLISHFTKQALLNLAGSETPVPTSRVEWAKLAQDLDVRVMHIAERDTQVTKKRKQIGEFVNTWSIEGFTYELLQPSELGWGTHEKHFPKDGHRYDFGRKNSIYLSTPSINVKVRSWTPHSGVHQPYLVTHCESITLSDYFTVWEGDEAVYRPTVHFA